MQLSDHFTLEEATESITADRYNYDNTPPSAVLDNMRTTAVRMEKVRSVLGDRPIKVTSWYRSRQVNVAAGSKATNSQHISGEAVDFKCYSYGSPYQICKILIANRDFIRFDQLILEHSWVHISFAILTRKPRGQVISLLANGDYAPGLTDKMGIPLTGD